MTLADTYSERYTKALTVVAERLEAHIKGIMSGIPHIDRISARAKSIDRFLAKADASENGVKKYSDSLNQIQDQIGARIVMFYLSDVGPASDQVLKYLKPIEVKDLVPDSEAEFGYFGKHFILLLPSDVTASVDKDLLPQFFA
jgi:putative GTP pyrophosphokinase